MRFMSGFLSMLRGLFNSRKFFLPVVTGVIIGLNSALEWGLSPETIDKIALLVVAAILGEAAKDAVAARNRGSM